MNPVLFSSLVLYMDNFAFNMTKCFCRSVMKNNNQEPNKCQLVKLKFVWFKYMYS
jgi:hypothetical protein